MTTWEKIALQLQRDCGIHVDWEERFFECPECGEPIYECDWSDSDVFTDELELGCPVCGCGW